ncbi:MAG: hypothetical protein WD691_07380 [Acidimicrobiales bacterium]
MTSADAIVSTLVDHLPEHLSRQRWSGAADRPIERVELLWHEVLSPEPPVLIWTLAHVHYADGDEQDYQLFVGARVARPMPKFLQGKDRELIALLSDESPPVVVYDALVDPDLAVDVLHLVAPELEVGVRRPIVLEHSNSSIVFDEAHILKVLRKIEPGPNPDVEITRVLAQQGFDAVLAPVAELRRDGVDLAVLREFLVGSTEGWDLARASVRDLLAGGEAPEESGADFAPDAERLGALLAELHLAMAEAWGRAPGDGARWANEMTESLDVVARLASALHPAVLDVGAIADQMDAMGALPDVGAEIRIHGDLHLAQLIKADAGWKVLDFEGEPARRRAERFTTSSPLRDLAGLLRSLHYAASTGLLEWGADDKELAELVDAWEIRNRDALCRGYLTADGIADLLPDDADARVVVLAAFELDKAVYELGYELGHRPDLIGIPLAAITRLLAAQASA